MIGQQPVAGLALGQRLLDRTAARDVPPRNNDVAALGQAKHGIEPDRVSILVSNPVAGS